MAIEKLNMEFIDGTTIIDAAMLGAFQNKINELVDKVNQTSPVDNYITFADPAVLEIILNNTSWSSDGIGLTYEDAAAVSTIGTTFMESAIESFDEFEHFTGVTAIEKCAFANCSNLTSIKFPPSLTTIKAGTSSSSTSPDRGAFHRCSALTSVTFNEGLESLNQYAFYGCSALTNVVLPSTLTTLGRGVFYACSSLGSMVIPEGVESTNIYLYATGRINAVDLPSTLTNIGNYTFHLTGIKNIICRAVEPPTFADTGNAINPDIVQVPAESVDAYKAAPKWSSYASVITAIS